jgi:hypothetical protein
MLAAAALALALADAPAGIVTDMTPRSWSRRCRKAG